MNCRTVPDHASYQVTGSHTAEKRKKQRSQNRQGNFGGRCVREAGVGCFRPPAIPPGPVSVPAKKGKKKAPRPNGRGAVMVRAATYSPGCDPSTIGAAGLNFSVRDGKRWGPCAGPPNVFSIKYAVNSIRQTVHCLTSCV